MYANINCTVLRWHPRTMDYLIPQMSQANPYRNWAKKLCGCEIGLKRRLLVTGMIWSQGSLTKPGGKFRLPPGSALDRRAAHLLTNVFQNSPVKRRQKQTLS